MREALVIGNLAWDESFAVAALPRPGASIPARSLSGGVGGKGANQAVALARALGAAGRVGLVAALAPDLRGAALRKALVAEDLDLHLVEYATLASDASVILRDDVGENAVITTQACTHALRAEDAIPHLQADLLVMQGNLRAEVTETLLAEAARRGLIRVLNPSPSQGITAAALDLAQIVVANEIETEAFGGAPALSRRAVLIRTMGPQGAELWQDGARQFHVTPPQVTPADPTGAGDCFLGALIGSMMRRGALRPEARDLEIAVWAGAVAVSRWGTQSSFPSAQDFARVLG